MRSRNRALGVLPVLAVVIGAVTASTTSSAAAAPGGSGWTVTGAELDAGGSNVVATADGVRLGRDDARAASARDDRPVGLAVFRPHHLGQPASGVTVPTVSATGSVDVEVRGRDGDGGWSEWVPVPRDAPAALPERTADLQVRAVLTGPDAVLRSITVQPADAVAARDDVSTDFAGLTYQVYATREGLVGHKTANGHHIGRDDHFVALPSRRGLGTNGSGEYTVRVCANDRCEWAPVWDVGPWNTTDDHWSTSASRQSWRDLPQGTPEAQAAYRKHYHGGKDQYGRKVSNPAGIDLGDGTYTKGLALKRNGIVSVTYQWTGHGVLGVVHSKDQPLNVRAGAAAGAKQVGIAVHDAHVRIQCRVTGQRVSGDLGTSTTWYRLAPGMFVAAAYLSGGSAAPAC